ncbi:PAS domain-containing sensor histidine kinase [Hymenobacter terrestris]|uniref:histidine kinase n=1 Tax=Hymenobacter terrestris TaxID=2748310 RepID=A0ABX2Q9S7_9BACT|nr:PAS domain-containing protein [Hymenobacter terrestris]NVO86459.1 PAS domain-containing protein [Hymenobacter terrestris]
MTTVAAPALPGETLPPDNLADVLFTTSPVGIMLLRPVYAADGTAIIDLAWERLNAAAQRMLNLPEQPTDSFLTLFPAAPEVGVYQFYRDAFLSGHVERRQNLYQDDQLDGYYELVAQRCGDVLVVHFTDGRDQPRTAVEEVLRASQTRERDARAEIEAQQATLRHTFEQVPVALGIAEGPDYVVTFANDGMLQLWGRPLATVVGRPHFEALPDLQGQGFEAIFADAYHRGQSCYLHEHLVQIDRQGTGQLVSGYFNIVYQPLRDRQQRITGIVASAIEVTEQVLARQQLQQLNEELERRVTARSADVRMALHEAEDQREQLRAQRALLDQILRQMPAAIATLTGPEHRYSFFNAPFQAISAQRVELGRTVAEVFPEVVEQGFIDLLDQVYATGEPYVSAETPVLLHNPTTGQAEPRYLDLVYQSLHGGPHQSLDILVFVLDVTDRVLARQEREDQQRLVESVFEQSPTAIWVVEGPDYVFTLVNPLMEQILGRTRQELLGRPYLQVMAELVSQGLPGLLARVWQSGETVAVKEWPARLAYHQPGETGYFSFVFQPLRDAQGRIARIACVTTDVTDQVVARQQVQTLNQELQLTNQELHGSNAQLLRTNMDLDNFIYTASHDLKAPISNIEGLLYLLQEDLPAAVVQDPEIGPTLSRMLDAVERFKRTIDHLTEVSRLQKEHAPAATLVNLAAVVEDVRQDLRSMLDVAGARLTVDVPALPPVPFTEKNLRSVVYNLLSNAVKYRHPDRTPHVDVRAHVREGHTVLEVHDNGLGLAPAYIPRLFTMFQRFHDHVEGTGIGLYMINRMVENAGGRIEVHSQLGAGTTFFVFLPHAASPAGQPLPTYIPS